jgi:hypothetical protein
MSWVYIDALTNQSIQKSPDFLKSSDKNKVYYPNRMDHSNFLAWALITLISHMSTNLVNKNRLYKRNYGKVL